jgi:hypothetical protein
MTDPSGPGAFHDRNLPTGVARTPRQRALRSHDALRKGMEPALARELMIVPGLNRSLLWLLAPELAWIARQRRLPFARSLFAVART